MISSFVQMFWNHYGWHFIFYGSLIALFVLWLYNRSGNEPGSFTIRLQDILKKVFRPVLDMDRVVTPVSDPLPVGSPQAPSKQDRQSRGEKKCKEFLERVFQKPFEKARPDFLTNPITSQPLELDCFNEELRLAVEYNGKQHYEYNKMMHQNSKHAFQNQKYRDHIKKELCAKFSIHLIIVPYIVTEEQIPAFLGNELKKLGFENQMVFI